MGFTTGFLGGATLTYSILYISLYIHRANRSVQRSLLAQQSTLLNSVVEPLPPLPDPPAYELRKVGLTEQLKDRWNREVEKLVRTIHETDWEEKRTVAEKKLATTWQSIKNSDSAKQLEAKANELGTEVKDKVRGVESKAADAKDELKNATKEPRLLELR